MSTGRRACCRANKPAAFAAPSCGKKSSARSGASIAIRLPRPWNRVHIREGSAGSCAGATTITSRA